MDTVECFASTPVFAAERKIAELFHRLRARHDANQLLAAIVFRPLRFSH
ncbi:hypothetical protein OP10G_4156 [Fimbriimonas ginsengisoli Gsoil 348]|uniref:Uncharacterized protein n=1 Tax=Fimbriimonas ginsengisoli Gsoil 348 TaxID=661478 RepID=A0A068NYW3_FIMGI|nr:hypothetical protein OP10G_4156 [Fimbriimonas ginsengisoli Gsoil 348]